MARPTSGGATIYDIARETGLSPSTVSRALSKPGMVSLATELTVRRAAERLGYIAHRPTEAPAARTGLIACVLPDNLNPAFAECAHAAQLVCNAKGFEMPIIDTMERPDVELRAIRRLAPQVDGLLLISPRCGEPELRKVAANVPTVLVNRRIQGLPSANSDMAVALHTAMETLRATGHTSMTLVLARGASWAGEYRHRLIWQTAGSFKMNCRLIRGCTPDERGGEAAFAQWQLHPTDAVFAYNDRQAVGFLHAAQRAGIAVPRDVSLVGCDGLLIAELEHPSLATFALFQEKLGDAAAAALVAAIRREKTAGPADIAIPAAFRPGESIGRRDGRPVAERSRLSADPMAALRRSKAVSLTLMSGSLEEITPGVEEFCRRYPQLTIDTLDAGSQVDTLARFWNRLQSRHNVPDLFRVEYDKMPEFALNGHLLNLSDGRLEERMQGLFHPYAWQAAHYGNGLFGVPMSVDSTVMFLRRDLLDRFGLPVPTTWEEYHDIGVELHRMDPLAHMGFINTTDAQHYLSFFRTAGAAPWQQETLSDISLTLDGEGMRQTAGFIQRCIDDGVLTAEPVTAPGFRRKLAEGRFAAIIHASWYANVITVADPDGAGRWKVALPPRASADGPLVTATVGGSVLTINPATARSKQNAAVAFALWMASNAKAVALNPLRTVSASMAYLNDPWRAEAIDPYFGQSIHRVYLESIAHLDRSWHPLPFMTQVDADFHDAMVPELRPGGDSTAALADWQEGAAGHAIAQGFSVR